MKVVKGCRIWSVRARHAHMAGTVFEVEKDAALVLADQLMAHGHDTDAARIVEAVTGVLLRSPPIDVELKPAMPTPWTRGQLALFRAQAVAR